MQNLVQGIRPSRCAITECGEPIALRSESACTARAPGSPNRPVPHARRLPAGPGRDPSSSSNAAARAARRSPLAPRRGGRHSRPPRPRSRSARPFTKRGYEATFIDDVARGARVTRDALYHQLRDLFRVVLEALVTNLTRKARQDSKLEMQRLGVPHKAPPRYAAGMEMLLDGLGEPAVRRVVPTDGPGVLGRKRGDELGGFRMLELVRGVFRDSFRRGSIRPELVEPLSHLPLWRTPGDRARHRERDEPCESPSGAWGCGARGAQIAAAPAGAEPARSKTRTCEALPQRKSERTSPSRPISTFVECFSLSAAC